MNVPVLTQSQSGTHRKLQILQCWKAHRVNRVIIKDRVITLDEEDHKNLELCGKM